MTPENQQVEGDKHNPTEVATQRGSLLTEPKATFAKNPGKLISYPNILWVGAGSFFHRVAQSQAFNDLLHKHKAYITVIDVHPRRNIEDFLNHDNVKYFDVSDHKQRKDLLYNRAKDENRLFSHCYIANWPQQHLLSCVKYSSLCAGGDIVITKPLDLNIPLVETVASGVFPDIQNKIIVDDHYRNKGCVRELHRILPELQKNYGKLRGFRMWIVEDKTIEEEDRLQALECGVIWDLASHLFSLLQLFFLDFPYQGLKAYCEEENPHNLEDVNVTIDKVLRKRYIGCKLMKPAETLAAIEVSITFQYSTYLHTLQKESIKGLLIVGKAATYASGVSGPLKQLDFRFEGGTVNLNLNTDRLAPPLESYGPEKETGFHMSVVELLRHSYRKAKQDNPKFDRTENSVAGRYHCGMSFHDSHYNVKLIQDVHSHDSAHELLRGYEEKTPICDILNELIGGDYLRREWLDEKRYGPFI